MQTAQAEERLVAMLAQAGFDRKRPDPQLAWEVWKSFVQEPVDCAQEGVLFQCGIDDDTGRERFTWGFVRQFWIDVEGEYDEEQLYFQLICAPTDELRKLHGESWSYEFATLGEFITKVEGLEEFQNPLRSSRNWSCEIELWKF